MRLYPKAKRDLGGIWWVRAAKCIYAMGWGRVRLQLYQQAHKSTRERCVDNEIHAGGGGGGCRLVIDEHCHCISGQCFAREHRTQAEQNSASVLSAFGRA